MACFSFAIGRAQTAPAAGQHADHSTPPAAFSGRIGLYKSALGPFTRPISSQNREAQAFFNQGFQLTYAFAKPEAVRSFREAEMRDPMCAICYWGEAWAWGSDLNWVMGPDEAPFAYAAIQKAVALAPAHATPIERAFIQAMSVRYVERFDPAKRVEQDRAYADAMKKVVDAYPDDLDAAALYAEALFLLEPRAGARDIANPNVQRIVGCAGARAEGQTSVIPARVICTSTSPRRRASPVAPPRAPNSSASRFPGASHINHMPSHTWTQIGRWGDAVRASLDAWHSDLKSLVGAKAIAIYPWHDLHMLVFAASMDGQGAIAVQAGRDYSRMTKNPIYLLLTFVRFGRFEDILEDMKTQTPGALSGPVWEFAQGYAHAPGGRPRQPRKHISSPVQDAANTSTAALRRESGEEALRRARRHPRGRDRAQQRRPAGRAGRLREGGLD